MAIAGASWLIDPIGAQTQFTGADFSDDDHVGTRAPRRTSSATTC